jgi:hypothetical protein
MIVYLHLFLYFKSGLIIALLDIINEYANIVDFNKEGSTIGSLIIIGTSSRSIDGWNESKNV